ncbi:MAG: amino acid permease [Anaerolineae bacterium]|nr:amino acid permease [Anaerolineae bacterium]
MFGLAVIALAIALALKLAPQDHHAENSAHKSKNAHIQTAGQIGLLGAVALFGVDYFTSFFYATGEMMRALQPVGLQSYSWVAVVIVALVNIIFGGLYIFALGIFRDGGGSYTASMRYLAPLLSLIVAVTLLEDYVLTVVVSALSGADQFLSITGNMNAGWVAHFLIGAGLATLTWFITIRGRGESARSVFTLLVVFVILTLLMAGGLVYAATTNTVAPYATITEGELAAHVPTLGEALFHLLNASMKGLVALTGLEAISNGIQFIKDEDISIVKWGKRRLPKLMPLWKFYSGKVGIGRFVQSSFLFYGGITTAFAAAFAVHFNVFDETAGRTLIGNLAYIGFSMFPNGDILFGAYQFLSVLLLAAASMTAFQDTQATAWRDVAIGEIPEFVCYRDAKGTFTRSVTATWIVSILIMLLVGGDTSHAIPFYGVGVFLPIGIMGLAVRRHILLTFQNARVRRIGANIAMVAAVIAGIVFLSQMFARWEEGGWVRIITFSVLFGGAHIILMSKLGKRTPERIKYIVIERARVQGSMASIVEWQSLKMQEYRHHLLTRLNGFLQRRFGIVREPEPVPMQAGPYNPSLHLD